MYSRQLEQLARQANTDRSAASSAARPAGQRLAQAARPAVAPAVTNLRSRTGWAIVSIGLRVAESANR